MSNNNDNSERLSENTMSELEKILHKDIMDIAGIADEQNLTSIERLNSLESAIEAISGVIVEKSQKLIKLVQGDVNVTTVKEFSELKELSAYLWLCLVMACKELNSLYDEIESEHFHISNEWGE